MPWELEIAFLFVVGFIGGIWNAIAGDALFTSIIPYLILAATSAVFLLNGFFYGHSYRKSQRST